MNCSGSKCLKSLGPQELQQAAECLRTLAHPHRLRIIEMLLHGSYTVGELAKACGIPSHMTSEHLRLMRDKGFLELEKRGRRVYYYIIDPGLQHIMDCIQKRYAQEK
ncbi:MAG: metalloregulator ArsR/SmtB family transcription factor [Desulfovermiculus sp.]|nr:metalloregulator ArsR/SmtB family transcription factor [Desulfovermiculus sp.]